MKSLIFLFVFCAVFKENNSLVSDNNDNSIEDLNTKDREGIFNSSHHFNRPHRPPRPKQPPKLNEHHHDRVEPTSERINPKAVNTETIAVTHNIAKSVENVSSNSSAMTYYADPNGIHLPSYGIALIALAMSLMFLIIMALLIMLYKMKKENRHRDSMNVAIQPKTDTTNFKYSRQLSGETSNGSTLLQDKPKDFKLHLTRSDSKALFINNLDTVDASKQKSPVDDIKASSITIPESNPPAAKKRPPTLTRILKQPANNYVPISPEKMSELCRGVLDRSKTKKTDDTISLSDNILSDSKNEEKEIFDLEKSLSTPELDRDMYDVPTPSPEKFFNSSVGIENEKLDNEVNDKPPKHNVEKKHPPQNKKIKDIDDNETDDGIYDNPVPNKHDNEVFDDGIYDNPPSNHNRQRNVVVSDDENEYVIPLSRDGGLYGNAKLFNDHHIIKNSL